MYRQDLIPQGASVAWLIQLQVFLWHLKTPTPSVQTRLQIRQMGRQKCYKSPSTLKRNARRLLVHLHKRISAIKIDSENMLDKSNDTSEYSEHNSCNFFTSTPRRLQITCEKCRNECVAKHHLEIHKKMAHGHSVSTSSYLAT